MSSPLRMPQVRRIGAFAAAVLFAAGVAQAQSNTSNDTSSSSSYSSSQSGMTQTELAEFVLPSAPTPSGSGGAGGGQYGNGGGSHGFLHNHSWAFEAGGGFNAPVGNDTDQAGVVSTPVPVITWGGNFTVGGGLRFNKWVSALAEYQFIGDKLPGALIADVNSAIDDGEYDISAGNTHINSITGSPVIDLFPKRTNGVYLVGGFGWYHKSTNFQAAEAVLSYYGEYYENVTVSSFTSNQWGGNAGFGLYHRLGGNMYGNDSETHSELFAETRYTFIHTPPASQANGLGTTELIPVTIGIRF